MQIPMRHTDLLVLYCSISIYLLWLLLRMPRSYQCARVDAWVCAWASVCVRVLTSARVCTTWHRACAEVRGQVFQSWFSSTSRVSLISTAVLCTPGQPACELCGDAPVSLSPIPQGECWVCRGNCRVWVFMWALGDSTQVRLPMEPSPWPPDSLLLKVATKSTAVHYYDSQFRKHCKYLWRRARPQGACTIKSWGRQHNPRVVSGLKDNGHLYWRFISRVTSIVIQEYTEQFIFSCWDYWHRERKWLHLSSIRPFKMQNYFFSHCQNKCTPLSVTQKHIIY